MSVAGLSASFFSGRLEVLQGGFEFDRPGQEDAFTRPEGPFRQEALFRLLGRQLLFLGERSVPHEHGAIKAMRHVHAPHRELVGSRIGLHENQTLHAVIHQGIRGNLDHVVWWREVHRDG